MRTYVYGGGVGYWRGACVGSKDSFQKSVPSLCHLGPRNGTQVVPAPLSTEPSRWHQENTMLYGKAWFVKASPQTSREMIDTIGYICKQLNSWTAVRCLNKMKRRPRVWAERFQDITSGRCVFWSRGSSREHSTEQKCTKDMHKQFTEDTRLTESAQDCGMWRTGVQGSWRDSEWGSWETPIHLWRQLPAFHQDAVRPNCLQVYLKC